MKCPKCGNNTSKVIDSRTAEEGKVIRRRRKCETCDYRFTTFERYEADSLLVKKGQGKIEAFSKDKLKESIVRATAKRIREEVLNKCVNDIVEQVRALDKNEVESFQIGELVLANLKKIDQVSFIRYASIFYKFDNIAAFMELIESTENEG